MAKTPLTKAMREEAVKRMVADLVAPKVDRARKAAEAAICSALRINTPVEILELSKSRPEYFEVVGTVTMSNGYTGNLSFSEKEERQACITIPATRMLRYAGNWPEVKEAIKAACGKPSCEELDWADDAVSAFDAAVAEREGFIFTAGRTLAQFRSVEALTAQWPDALKYVSVPEKRNLPAVRCDDLVGMIKALEGEVAQ